MHLNPKASHGILLFSKMTHLAAVPERVPLCKPFKGDVYKFHYLEFVQACG